MKKMNVLSAVAAVVLALSGCGGGGGDREVDEVLIDVPVGAWSSPDDSETVPRLRRQLFVLPPVEAGGPSDVWGLEFSVVGGGVAPQPQYLVNGQLAATASSLAGSGRVEDFTAVPSTNTAVSVTVVPNVSGSTLTVAAADKSWSLARNPAPVAPAEDDPWTGVFESVADGGSLAVKWTLNSTTLTVGDVDDDDETAGCTYAGTMTSVNHPNLADVVRVAFDSTNTDSSKKLECGDWQGMGTVSRNEVGSVEGRTLWLRSSAGKLRLVSLTLKPS
jgi:hypothetical protein